MPAQSKDLKELSKSSGDWVEIRKKGSLWFGDGKGAIYRFNRNFHVLLSECDGSKRRHNVGCLFSESRCGRTERPTTLDSLARPQSGKGLIGGKIVHHKCKTTI